MNDQVFAILLALIAPFITAGVIAVSIKIKFLWPSVNQPTVAGIAGGICGALYHMTPVYSYFNGHTPTGSPGDFIVFGVMAGLSGTGLHAVFKDVTTGAIATNSPEGISDLKVSAVKEAITNTEKEP